MKYHLVIILGTLFVLEQVQTEESNPPGRAALDNFPVIDGHNDVAHNVYEKLQNKIYNFRFSQNLKDDSLFGTANCSSCHTDIPRLRQGKVGAQFWAAYVDCKYKDNDAVVRYLEQIDVIKRLIANYPSNLEFVTTSDGILKAIKNNKIASLIGMEGGHGINSNLAILRMHYDLGVRYMTLTHSCDTPWAHGSPKDVKDKENAKLTAFGKIIVWEMNRLGMMVDISHVAKNVMKKVLSISKAPVIFSHSSSYSIYKHHRNVADDILHKLKTNRGIIMVNFVHEFLGDENSTVTIDTVVEHINHIVDVIGVDHVGIGADFDGVKRTPVGLEDVSKYPYLFDRLRELNPKRWTISNLEKLAGRNIVRVFKEVEKVKDSLKYTEPYENLITDDDLAATKWCKCN